MELELKKEERSYTLEIKRGVRDYFTDRFVTIIFHRDFEDMNWRFVKCNYRFQKGSYNRGDWRFLREVANEIDRIDEQLKHSKLIWIPKKLRK